MNTWTAAAVTAISRIATHDTMLETSWQLARAIQGIEDAIGALSKIDCSVVHAEAQPCQVCAVRKQLASLRG